MPKTVPDENDLIYETYGLDIEGIFRYLYEKIMGGDWNALLTTLEHWWNIYSIIALLLSLLFFIGFIYAKLRYGQLSEIEAEAIIEGEAQWARKYGKAAETKNARWKVIEERVTESSPESWRIAIIEADILLDETLTNAGYVGQTIGEKLKTANTTSFTTVQDAWEAHKVRNEVAHRGSDFVLTQKVAKEAIVRFERVFREFGVI